MWPRLLARTREELGAYKALLPTVGDERLDLWKGGPRLILNPSKVKHWLALVLVVSLSALGTRLVPHPQARSNYTHGSVSVEGIFPYMPDEEVEKNFGRPVQESQGQVNLYSRDGHRARVDFDSVSWCATGVSGSRLEVNGLAVLRVGDLQSKAERVLRRLSQDGKVGFVGFDYWTAIRGETTLEARYWDSLKVVCLSGRVKSIEMQGH